MIARFVLFVLMLYALGFALFAVTLPKPAAEPAAKTQAIIALTGGGGRIEHGVRLLEQGKGKRLLISGADPLVTKADLVKRVGGKRALFDCCVDLDSTSVDTRSNATEAKKWMAKHGYTSVRLVTGDSHMRRAAYEFERTLDKNDTIVIDAVRTEPSLTTLFAEYTKYLLRRLTVRLDV